MNLTRSQASRRKSWWNDKSEERLLGLCLGYQARCARYNCQSCVLAMMVRILVACLGEWEGLQTLSHIVRAGAESIPDTQVSVKVIRSIQGEDQSRDEEVERCALRSDMETADAILLGISENRDSGQDEDRDDAVIKALEDQIGRSSGLAGKVGSAFAVFSMDEASENEGVKRKRAERSIEKICNAFLWHGMILSGIPMNAHRSGPLPIANGVCARFDDRNQSDWPGEYNDGNHASRHSMGNSRNRNRLNYFNDRDIRNAFFQGQWTASIAWRLQMSAEAFRQSYEQSPMRTRFDLRPERPERNPVGERVGNVEAAAERPQSISIPPIAQRYPAREEVTADSGDNNENEEAPARRERGHGAS